MMIHLDIHVLLVENNSADAQMIANLIQNAGMDETVRPVIHLEHASTQKQALSILEHKSVDAVIFDLNGMPGDEMCVATSQISAVSHAPVIIISSVYDETTALQAIQSGALDFLVKGKLDGDELRKTIIYANECKRIEQALHIKLSALLDMA